MYWCRKRSTTKLRGQQISIGFPHLHQPHHLQAPRGRHFDEIHPYDLFCVFYAGSHCQIQVNVHAANEQKGRTNETDKVAAVCNDQNRLQTYTYNMDNIRTFLDFFRSPLCRRGFLVSSFSSLSELASSVAL